MVALRPSQPLPSEHVQHTVLTPPHLLQGSRAKGKLHPTRHSRPR